MLKKSIFKILLTLMLVGLFTLHSFTFFFNMKARGTELLLETDKSNYRPGENVTITLANISNETIEIGGYPAWQIFTYPEETPVYPKIFAFLAWSLESGEEDIIVWNQYNEFTNSFSAIGTYFIKDTQGWGLSIIFSISFLGDINGDLKVDMRDISICGSAFGSTPGHPKWNPVADVDYNERIDMRDIGLVARDFGKAV